MKSWLSRFIKHLCTVLIHKYWVGYYCFKSGLYWRGLVHDLSKFNPIEFFEGVKYYQGDRSPIDKCKEVNGFSKAWLHHKGRNKHHYEYWCDNIERGLSCPKIPFTYMLEMVCDYLGAGRAYMGKEFTYQAEYIWWRDWKRQQSRMHQSSKNFMTHILSSLSNGEDIKNVLNKKSLKLIYEKL